ncbi:MAG: DUF2065 domain-containing protein [Desulfuromonas sp.]|nr:MAG: DUF2065 domain-containing protein [Desulfuromonas sp.]
MSYLLSVIGVVLIFEGMPWFLSPEKTKKMLARIHQLPDSTLRFFGFSAMVIGLLLVRFSS